MVTLLVSFQKVVTLWHPPPPNGLGYKNQFGAEPNHSAVKAGPDAAEKNVCFYFTFFIETIFKTSFTENQQHGLKGTPPPTPHHQHFDPFDYKLPPFLVNQQHFHDSCMFYSLLLSTEASSRLVPPVSLLRRLQERPWALVMLPWQPALKTGSWPEANMIWQARMCMRWCVGVLFFFLMRVCIFLVHLQRRLGVSYMHACVCA